MNARHSLICLATLLVATAANGQVVDPILFNASTNAGPDDPPGLGINFTSSSQVLGVDDEEGAFGNNDGPVEPNTFIFGDGGTPDNGNGILGDGGETVDSLNWQTSSLVTLDGYRLTVGGDGAGANRATELAAFSVAGEQDDLFDNNAFHGSVDRIFSVPQLGEAFQLNTTRTLSSGPRLFELDAIVPDPLPSNLIVDPILFNAITNNVGEGDEAPGLGTNFVASSAVLGADTPEDAFGNNNGAVEPNTFIFGDGGTSDNGNNIFDPGLETIDLLQWETTAPVSIGGYEIQFGGDVAGPHAFRGAELMSFLVGGTVVDTIDLNGYGGGVITLQRAFAGGPVSGSQFAIQLTRSTLGGPRIHEINAIVVVPEPTSLGLIAVGLLGAGLISRRRRQPTCRQ